MHLCTFTAYYKQDLTTSLKLWLERMPNCLREALAYADEKVQYCFQEKNCVLPKIFLYFAISPSPVLDCRWKNAQPIGVTLL